MMLIDTPIFARGGNTPQQRSLLLLIVADADAAIRRHRRRLILLTPLPSMSFAISPLRFHAIRSTLIASATLIIRE